MTELDTVFALDFSHWKRPVMRGFFSGRKVVFVDSLSKVPTGSLLAVWGCSPLSGQLPEGLRLIRMEDGFIRSVGLGADLIRAVSWVGDYSGIYYDATRPSDLEQILQNHQFTSAELERAEALRIRIVTSGITKYNLGRLEWVRPKGANRVILVPGQVESDASLRYGAPGLRTNLELLQAVRKANPKAFILYKPHPDVMAGLRARGRNDQAISQYCDAVLPEADMGQLLEKIDEVHVLTSLTGFEALLRGKPVSCYGQPFYAGWGLTLDLLPTERRTRKLNLDELVAGALLLYPRYISRVDSRLIEAEQALEELLQWRAQEPVSPTLWRKLFRVLLRQVVGVR